MIGRFFHTPKARQFNIPYRYYNPEKEEMQEREKQIKMELGMLKDKGWDPGRRTDLRGKFRQAMHVSTKSATDARKRSNTRLIILILVLSMIVYFYLKI